VIGRPDGENAGAYAISSSIFGGLEKDKDRVLGTYIGREFRQDGDELSMVTLSYVQINSAMAYEANRPERSIYSINMNYPSYSIPSKGLPLVDVPFERVWMCVTVRMEIITCGILYVNCVCLLEGEDKQVRHNERELAEPALRIRNASMVRPRLEVVA